ncbi:MAG: hypothetical protein LC808_13045, partial [Actinobacteria bacterium]|nr:hypothetical protein [Actinomycetota bacterium]
MGVIDAGLACPAPITLADSVGGVDGVAPRLRFSDVSIEVSDDEAVSLKLLKARDSPSEMYVALGDSISIDLYA